MWDTYVHFGENIIENILKLFFNDYTDREIKADLLTAMGIFASLKNKNIALRLFERRQDIMIESPFIDFIREEAIKEGKEKGIQLGIKEGLQQGLQQGLHEAISLGLEIKFGIKSLFLMEKIYNVNSVARLEMIKEANEIAEIEDLLEK